MIASKPFRLTPSSAAADGVLTSTATSSDSSGTTTWFQAEMALTRGSIGIEDTVQIEGSSPPAVGIVTGLWHRDGSTAERISKDGVFATRLIIRVEGIDPNLIRAARALVPAPVGALPPAQPVPVAPLLPIPQPATPLDGLPDFARQLLRPAQNNGTTTSVRTTTTSSSGTTYVTESSTNSFSFQVTRDGQPVQTYDQKTADGIGPILVGVGPDPAAVVQALQQWCQMGPRPAQEFLLTVPAPIPDLYPLNEAFLDGLAAAFRQAGAMVLVPGPDAPIRLLARHAGSTGTPSTAR